MRTLIFFLIYFFYINIILLYLYFEDIYLFLPFLLTFTIFWFLFFKLNFFSNKNTALAIDSYKVSNFSYNTHSSFLIFLNKIFLLFFAFYLYSFKGVSDSIWWQHFKLTNLNFNIVLILILVNIVMLILIESSLINLTNVRLDYFFALVNLSIFLPLVFYANTLFTFLFVLEFTSLLVFYKFVVSKVWKLNKLNINSFILFRNLPKYYLNMLFFQYWATFFSSVLIVFSLISFIYQYGTTEWFTLNLLNEFNLNFKVEVINNFITLFILVFGFLIKIGFTPIHLYKIEVYKGLPFYAIFFYTVYYFLVFFLFFILLTLLYLESFLIYFNYIITLIVVLGLILVVSLLFSINYVKAFFAYSSIVNSVGFVTIVLALII